MRTHPSHKKIALPQTLSELRVATYQEKLVFTDERDFYHGVIFSSSELENLSRKFSYEALGHDVIAAGPNMLERGPLAKWKDGRLTDMFQATYVSGQEFIQSDFDPDLKQFLPVWEQALSEYGFEVGACLGNEFEVRLKRLSHDVEVFHKDRGMIVLIQPVSDESVDKESTVCIGEDNSRITEVNKLVGCTPELQHSWPVSTAPRMIYAAMVYDHQFG